MKQRMKRIIAPLLALLLALSFSAALADVAAEADQTDVRAGDTVRVTLTVTGKNLSVAQGIFTYDPALLSFTQSDGGAADGFFTLYSAAQNGSSALRAVITFTARAAGAATVDFTLQSLVDYKGNALETGSAQVSFTIEATPAPPSATPVDYSDPAMSVRAAQVSGAQGDFYIWRNIDNVTIPSRYALADIDYHGEIVQGAAANNADVPTLLYGSDAAGGNAGYYIYDAAKDTLFPYRTVSSVSKTYILLQPDGSIAVPEGFAETTLAIGDDTVQAWSSTDAQGTIYLLYARNPDGDIGFYLYHPKDQSLQRFAVLPARPIVTPPAASATPAPVQQSLPPATQPVEMQPDGGQILLTKTVFFALCATALTLLALLITTITLHALREKQREQRALARKNAREHPDTIDTGV